MRSSGGFLVRARTLALGALLFLPTLAIAAGAPVVAPDATSFTLDNGLQVVVIPAHGAPVVTQMIWYKAGAADEVPGKSGIAHFLEHLMFKGTKIHAAGEFSAKVSEIGGDENAFTSSDYTAYYQTVAKENLPIVMAFEADRMENLVLTDEVVLPERQVILEERRSRTDNDPGSQLNEAMGAALFQNSHYGIPVIGWEHEMQGLTKDDAVAWYDRYYTPNNAILVIAGDVTVDEVKKLAADTFAQGTAPRRARRTPPRAGTATARRPRRHDGRPPRLAADRSARIPGAFLWLRPGKGSARPRRALRHSGRRHHQPPLQVPRRRQGRRRQRRRLVRRHRHRPDELWRLRRAAWRYHAGKTGGRGGLDHRHRSGTRASATTNSPAPSATFWPTPSTRRIALEPSRASSARPSPPATPSKMSSNGRPAFRASPPPTCRTSRRNTST